MAIGWRLRSLIIHNQKIKQYVFWSVMIIKRAINRSHILIRDNRSGIIISVNGDAIRSEINKVNGVVFLLYSFTCSKIGFR